MDSLDHVDQLCNILRLDGEFSAVYDGVVNNTCDYSGVMVFAFKDNIAHPSLEVGDIIFEFDGKKIMSRDDLKEAYSQNKEGEMSVYRLSDGILEIVCVGKLTNSDIVGLLDIVDTFYDEDTEGAL